MLDYQLQQTAKAVGHLAAAYQAALNKIEELQAENAELRARLDWQGRDREPSKKEV